MTSECTLVVDPEVIIEALKRNNRNADTRQTHVLRFSRPLDGRVVASHHIDEESHYWPNPKTAPLTLHPDVFVEADARQPPKQWTIYEDAKELEGVNDIDDVSDETLCECENVHFEVWKTAVRRVLKSEVDINAEDCDTESRVVSVEYVEGV